MKRANKDIRKAVKESGITLWRLAEKIGIADSTLSVRLRHELSPADKELYMKAIKEAAEEMEKE